MRWLFACLLFINILYALWQVQQGRISWSSELSEAAAPTATPQAESGAALREGESLGLCMHLGGFGDDAALSALRQRLLVLGVAAEIVGVDKLTAEDYLLYRSPSGSRQQVMAELRLLQVAGVESYLIAQGELAGRIALGVFASEAAARDRQLQIRSLGYESSVEQMARYETEQWLQVQGSSSRLIDAAMLQQLRLSFPRLTHHYRPCSTGQLP